MKKVFSILASLAFAGSVFAGCPSKTIKGKFLSFDEGSKTINVQSGKKKHAIKISSSTKMVGFKAVADIKKDQFISLEGCNCKKTASSVAMGKGGKGKGKKEKKG